MAKDFWDGFTKLPAITQIIFILTFGFVIYCSISNKTEVIAIINFLLISYRAIRGLTDANSNSGSSGGSANNSPGQIVSPIEVK